jgi:hypothetical protein
LRFRHILQRSYGRRPGSLTDLRALWKIPGLSNAGTSFAVSAVVEEEIFPA